MRALKWRTSPTEHANTSTTRCVFSGQKHGRVTRPKGGEQSAVMACSTATAASSFHTHTHRVPTAERRLSHPGSQGRRPLSSSHRHKADTNVTLWKIITNKRTADCKQLAPLSGLSLVISLNPGRGQDHGEGRGGRRGEVGVRRWRCGWWEGPYHVWKEEITRRTWQPRCT